MANLANFSYDPINYDYFRKLNVVYLLSFQITQIDLFADYITDKDEQLKEFAIGGLCNLSTDLENQKIIYQIDCIVDIICCLSSTNQNVVTSALTTLYNLYPYKKIRKQLENEELVNAMNKLSNSPYPVIKNLSLCYLSQRKNYLVN